MSSVSPDLRALKSDSILVDSANLNTVSRVDVSLGDRVDDILGSVAHFLLACWEHLDHAVVSNELVVEDWGSELGTRSLHSIGDLVVRADGIISIDAALAILIDSTEQIEGVVWHEAAAVEDVHKSWGHGLDSWLFLVLHLVHLDDEEQVLVQSLHIGNHAA